MLYIDMYTSIYKKNFNYVNAISKSAKISQKDSNLSIFF